MNRLIGLFVLFCFSGSIKIAAQQKQKDSIYTLLQQQNTQDTNRLKLLNNYARMIRYDSVTLSYQYINEAIRISKKIKNEYWLGQSFNSLAMSLDLEGRTKEALLYLDTAQKLFEKGNQLDALIISLGQRGQIYHNQGKYSDVIDIQHETIKLSEKTGNIDEAAKSYGEIANIYFSIGMYKDAIKMYDSACVKFMHLGDTTLAGLCYANSGQSFIWLKDYVAAKGKFDTAIVYYNLAGRTDIAASTSGSLALVKAHLGEYKEALSLAHFSLDEMEKRKNSRHVSQNMLNIAKIILLGFDKVKDKNFNYDTAMFYAQKGYSMASENNYIRSKIYGMEILAELYNRNGEYKKAYYFLNENYRLKDSISGSQKSQEIAIKDAQFISEKQTAILNAAHSAELERQKNIRNFSIAGIAFVLLSSALLFWQYKHRRDAQAKQKEAEQQARVAEIETKVLRLQMNPHFIFNSLNSIGDYLLKNDTRAADEYLAKFAKLMRLVLENSEHKKVKLSEDLKALELYMQLESLRLNNRFSYSINVQEGIDTEEILIPPSLLQPLVENSIWHGIAPAGKEGYITINIQQDGDGIRYAVEDNGVGLGPLHGEAVPENDGSFGTKITRSRVEFIRQTQYSKAFIKWLSPGNGTTVQLLLPAI